MSNAFQHLVDEYTAALQDYLGGAAEVALAHAYQLGRKALADGLGVLDIAAAHQEALAKVLTPELGSEEAAQTVKRATGFLAESLSSFEMTHRGFQETIARLLEVNETLRKSEAKNRALLNAIPDSMFRISGDGTYLDFKAGPKGDPTSSPRHVVGKNVAEVLPAELAEQVMQYVARALRDGGIQIFEYELLNSGARRAYEARIVVSGRDEVLAIVRDITEERRREREKEAVAQITRALVRELELPRVADVVIEQSSKVLGADAVELFLANPAHRELTLLAYRLQNPELVESIRQISYDAPLIASTAARTEQIQVVEDLLALGPEFPVARRLAEQEGVRGMVAVPLRSRGRLVGVVSFFTREVGHFTPRDLEFNATIADLFAVAIENAHLYNEVRQALRLREEFMAAAAHELKTPVTTIKGWAELLLKTDQPLTRERQGLETISRQTDRIKRLIEDLLAAIRLRPGPTALRREQLDLSTLTQEIARQTAVTTDQYQFRVAVDGPLAVEGDRQLITEALSHLLENAMRYMPAGGTIRVEARRAAEEAIVSVHDIGVGIPLDRQPHVFEPFYEPIPAGAPGYVGVVSLGLHLSKQIVEAHGGRIWFASTPGEGSTFSFSLPLAGAP